MCIEIAPVEDGTLGKPGNSTQGTHSKAFAEDGEGLREGWERQKDLFIFGYDTAFCLEGKLCELRVRQTQIGQWQSVALEELIIEKTDTYEWLVIAQSETLSECFCVWQYGFRGE